MAGHISPEPGDQARSLAPRPTQLSLSQIQHRLKIWKVRILRPFLRPMCRVLPVLAPELSRLLKSAASVLPAGPPVSRRLSAGRRPAQARPAAIERRRVRAASRWRETVRAGRFPDLRISTGGCQRPTGYPGGGRQGLCFYEEGVNRPGRLRHRAESATRGREGQCMTTDFVVYQKANVLAPFATASRPVKRSERKTA